MAVCSPSRTTRSSVIRCGPMASCPGSSRDVIVSGLPRTGDHPMHPFIIDAEGHLFVDLGSATNSCQKENRIAEFAGLPALYRATDSCRHLALRCEQRGPAFLPGGTVRHRTAQRRGICVRFRWAPVRHPCMAATSSHRTGRISITADQSAQLPAEEIVQLEHGADFGWPECYYDGIQKKLVLAPEYGGERQEDRRMRREASAGRVLPGHWAPNDLLIYSGMRFPLPIRAAPLSPFMARGIARRFPQGGYNVVFQPLNDGKACGAICGLRRWICRCGEGARPGRAPALGTCGGT